MVARVVEMRAIGTVRRTSSGIAGDVFGLQARVRGRHPFRSGVGVEGHNQTPRSAAAARKRILSYMEAGDLMAIDAASKGPFLRRIAKNAAEHRSSIGMMFGFSYQERGSLVEFLKVLATTCDK